MCLPSSVKRWMRALPRSATVRIGCAAAAVHDDAVRAIQLAGLLALAAEGADVLALAVVLVDVAGAVAVAHVEIAVGRDGEVGGAVLRLLAVGAGLVGLGLIRVAEREDLFAVERRLHHDAARRVAEVEVFGAALLLDVQPVRAALELLAPALDELALFVEDHHGVGAFAGGVDGVVHVDVALRILDHAVGVAVLDPRRQFAPVVDRLVGVFAAADDGRFGSGFVGGAQDRRGQRAGLHESPPRSAHGREYTTTPPPAARCIRWRRWGRRY